MNLYIEIKLLELKIKNKQILSKISFDLKNPSIIAIIGPNGAGKTSLLQALFYPQKTKKLTFKIGELNIAKLSMADYAGKISYLASSDFSQPKISVKEFFINSCYLKKIEEEKIIRSLATWGLESILNKEVNTLSLGQFQRLLLATTFSQDVSLYLLDEPERHLDPEGIDRFREEAKKLKDSGKTIIYASHDLNLVSSLGDYYLGLDSLGTQVFFKNRNTLFSDKYLDKLFNIQFKYVNLIDGNERVFI